MKISISDPMKTWVDGRLKTGSFSSTSEYVRDLICRDQERQQAIDDLQAAIDEGARSGEAKPFDFKAFKARMCKRHAER
jgi:antitoxin ParD1/3/4